MSMITEILTHGLINAPEDDLSLVLLIFNGADIWPKQAQLASMVFTSQNSYERLDRTVAIMLDSTHKLTCVHNLNQEK